MAPLPTPISHSPSLLRRGPTDHVRDLRGAESRVGGCEYGRIGTSNRALLRLRHLRCRRLTRPDRPFRVSRPQTRRIRMGPLTVEGSTTCPPCKICTSPDSTSRRAAHLAGSIRSRHPFGFEGVAPTARAASEGQMLADRARVLNSSRIFCSSSASAAVTPRLRHAELQYRTCSQSRSHFLRHSNRRPQATHILDFGVLTLPSLPVSPIGISPRPRPGPIQWTRRFLLRLSNWLCAAA